MRSYLPIGFVRGCVLAVVFLTSTHPALAQTVDRSLSTASLEDLMNIQITSASHKEQRLGDVAAAVFVITQDDIRRSGLTTLPELLRLAPGVQVARINSNKWAVGIRGFNNLFTDKLLVLIDGRTTYDRLNSGVFWESLNIPVDQIERIEIVRGAGGATWGANAVNGVINVVTKSAADTKGAAITTATGTFDGPRFAARYGGSIGRLAYRINSTWSGGRASRLDGHAPAGDGWESQEHGLRLDWAHSANTLTVEGDATMGRLRGLWRTGTGPVPAVKPPFDEWTYTREYSALGRWTRRLQGGASLRVQSFFDFRHNQDTVNPTQRLADIDAQYHRPFGGIHDLVIGGGYRHLDERTEGGYAFSIVPARLSESVVNAFAQDEIAIGSSLRVTLGAKVERDAFAGWGSQPTVRGIWRLTPRQHVWAAYSRALRAPSLSDVAGRYNYTSFIGQGGMPVVVGAIGNPAFAPERVHASEAGYRVEIGATAHVDVTAFTSHYSNLKTREPLAPRFEATPAPAHLFIPVQFQNLLDATGTGAEVIGHWTVRPWWRLDGNVSTLHLTPRLSPLSHDAAAAAFDGNAPRAQWQVTSDFSLKAVRADLLVFHSSALGSLSIPAYTRADTRVELPLGRHASVAGVGRNLLDPAHGEFGGRGAIVTPTFVPRSAEIQLSWHF